MLIHHPLPIKQPTNQTNKLFDDDDDDDDVNSNEFKQQQQQNRPPIVVIFFSFTSTHRTEIFFCPFAYSFNDSLSLSHPMVKLMIVVIIHSFILSIQYNRTQEKKYEYK